MILRGLSISGVVAVVLLLPLSLSAASPTITSLSPTSGAVGASVTIAGTGFGSTQGTSTVKFNGTTATATSWSATSIVTTVPTGATTGNVVVTVSGVASGGKSFTVVAAPSVTSLSPTSGAVGASVTITGTNFGATQGTNTVKFNATTATPTSWSATSIVVPVPVGATTGNVVVHASGVDSNGSSFTVLPTPSITSLSPTSGAVGASVTITGTNFGATQGTSTVKFNTIAATTITSWSATSIVATVPTGATTGNVVVTVSGVASNGSAFTVVAAPSITSLSPTSGPAGTAVTITGTNFGATQGTSTVKFNGTAATTITSWSATSIVVPVPSGATTGNVVVHASGVDSNGSSFTVIPTPSITSLSPTSGAVGASVTITGTNFGATQGTSTVKFNTTTATTITSWSATSIVATVPTGATTGNVVVTVAGAASNGAIFTVTASAPTIASLSPTVGPTGTAVTINGSRFGATQGSSTVTLNGVTAVPTSWSATSIVAPVPSGATSGNVLVVVGGIASNGVLFTVGHAPIISSLSPTSGAVGTSVTISGSDLGSVQGGSKVTFNGTQSSPVTWTATSIVVPVPIGATTGNVVVTVGGTASNGISFTVTSGPNIASLSPGAGPVGTGVTVSGTNFGATQGTSTVAFNGTTATPTYWNPSLIGVPVPSSATTGNVVVTVGGSASNPVNFTVGVVPSVRSLSPTAGPIGSSVSIFGSNFGATQGSSTVTFSGVTATPISWSDTFIQVTVPPGATTGNVVVSVGVISSNPINYTVGPGISSVSPTLAAIGTAITISGNNFGSTQGSSTVTFNGTTAIPTSWNASSIVAPVPTGATTGNLVVKVAGTSSNGVLFTVGAPPSITSLSPTSGPAGLLVTITGNSFGSFQQPTSTVMFNGTLASPNTWSDTSITVPVPKGATTGNVVLNVGGVASNGISFTVIPGPGASQVQPPSGGFGSLVFITGCNFGATQGSSIVTLNGTTVTSNYWSDTGVQFVVPSGATTGNVVVTVGGIASNGLGFTVIPTPTIQSLSPGAGPVGITVTVYGFSFGPTQGTSTVTFNGIAATPISWSQTSVVVPVPTGATTGNVVVTVGGVASTGLSFTVRSGPGITNVSPALAPVGTPVTINGGAFGATQGTSTITFNGTTATPTSWSASSMIVPVPSGATTGNVVVTVGGVTSNAMLFTVGSNPSIASLSPSSGAVGASVTISGSNFGASRGTSVVTFSGAQASSRSWSQSSIVVPVPPGASTGNVVVTVAGVASNGVIYTVTPGPGISNLSRMTGAVGASVSIFGAGFGTSQGASTVTFNGTTAPPTSWSDTSIIAPVPSGSTTGNVVVTVGGILSNPMPFTVVSLPHVTSVSPTAGTPAVTINSIFFPGTTITITGTGFGSSTQSGNNIVKFGSLGSAGSSNWSDTSIVLDGSILSFSVASVTTVPLTVQPGDSGVASNPIYFTMLPVPTITGISPTSGSVGTSITITGVRFGVRQGSSTVTFSTGVATPTAWSDTSITVPVPSTASTGPIVVTANGISSNGQTFTLPPVVTTLSPNSASTNVPVTVSGTGFGNTENPHSCVRSTINFTCASCSGSVLAHPTQWTTNSIVVPVPNLATTGPVVVTVCGTASNGSTFTVPVPTTGTVTGVISRLADGSPLSGASVSARQSGTTVGSTTTALNGSYSIANLAPGAYDIQASATGYVTAVKPGNTVTANTTIKINLPLGPAPLLTAISPAFGAQGTPVTLSGSNFGPTQMVSTVTFNGVSATPTNWSTSSIAVPVPAGATTGNVIVTVGGVASNPLNFGVGTGVISGTITSAANSSAINAALIEALQSNTVQASATSTSNGTYSITSLAPGTYDVRISATGFGTLVNQGKIVAVGAPTTVNAALPGAGTDSGQVTKSSGGSAIPGASVAALQNNVLVSSTTTDSSGNFSLAKLSAGTYTIQVSAQGYTTQTTTGVTVSTGSSTTTNFSLEGQSVVTYDYDELGRLVGVVDSQNGAAVYNYDAVGNITSIGRPGVGQVSIISFTPKSGPVGSTVTINGNNFSSIAGQNTATFNGTSAVVGAASMTQLVVTVPTGAASGPIAVTAPAGSATSGNSFTVGTSGSTPTITSISPTTAAVGGSVSITGTNFDPSPVNDSVTVNGVLKAIVTSASSTNLGVTVPSNASTGYLGVGTPKGKVTSSGYLFVAPAPHPATDIGYTGQISSLPGTQTVAIALNKMGLLAFDGVAGQRVILQTANSTYPNGCGVPGSLVGPSGSVLYTHGCMGGNGIFSGPITLPQTGTYTTQMGPNTTGAGQVNITITNVAPDITGTIYPSTSGTTVGPLTTTTAGQRFMLTFNGTLNKRIFLIVNVTSFVGNLSGTLFNPDGTQLGTMTPSSGILYMGATTLSQTGTYPIQLAPGGTAMGTIMATLYDVPQDPTAILPINGAATVQTTVPGQQGHLTFTGSASQQVSLNVNSTGAPNFSWWISITNPDGSSLFSRQSGNNTLFMDKTTLPATGTYSILIFPDSHQPTMTGSWTANLYNVPADVTGSVSIGGSSLPIAIGTPGQNAAVTFAGTASQHATVAFSGNTIGQVGITLLKPDGTTLVSTGSSSASFNLGSQTLPTTGTYTIKIDPSGPVTGNVSVNVTSP